MSLRMGRDEAGACPCGFGTKGPVGGMNGDSPLLHYMEMMSFRVDSGGLPRTHVFLIEQP